MALAGCEGSGENPPETAANVNDNSDSSTVSVENLNTEVSLSGQSGEITEVTEITQQSAGQNITNNDDKNVAFTNAEGQLRQSNLGAGNFTLGLTAVDPDGITKVLLYLPNVNRSFILCTTDCGMDYQVILTGINPH